MKSPHTRTYFFAALVLFVAFQAAALGQTKSNAPDPPPPKPMPRDIPYGIPTAPPRPAQTGPVEWSEFKSEAGGFSVKFPAAPRVGQVSFNKGPVALTRHTHTASLGSEIQFEVDFVDMPAGYNDPDLSLEGGISGLTHAMEVRGARSLTKETVVRGKCEGRDTTLSLPNTPPRRDGFAEGRIFSSGQRYYFLIFIGEEDSPSVREMARTFMESFAVTDGCTSVVAPVPVPSTPVTASIVEGTPDPATGWRKIENDQLGFGVLMPGAARRESEQAQVEPFPLTHHTYIQEDDSSVFSAEVFGEYPPNFYNTPGSYQTMIDITFYALKRNFEPAGFALTPLRDLKVGTFPGREFTVTNEKLGAKGRAQIYVTTKYIYVFTAFVRGQAAASPTTLDRFFSSVRISTK
jgi:hypothetical protein